MTLADLHDSDLAFIIADAGAATFTFNGADYDCFTSDKEKAKELEEGGFMEVFDLSIVTRASLFETAPAENQLLTFGGQQYRISKTRLNLTGKILTLNCMSDAK